MITNLQITAHMATPLAVSDNWSPALDALLEYLWLDERGLISPHPTKENLIPADIPLRKDSCQQESFWACSSPFYIYESEQVDRFRKRWDYQDRHLNWGKKKAKVDTQQGATKSYDLPLRLINVPRLDWFAVGDLEQVEKLLAGCTNLGKKRSYGKGQVYRWEVKEIEEDWSLYKNNRLTRPFPASLLDSFEGYDLMRWGWKTPSWLPESVALCAMPPNNQVIEESLLDRTDIPR